MKNEYNYQLCHISNNIFKHITKIANRIEYATPTDRNIPLNKTTEEKRQPEICNWCFSKMVDVPYP